MKSNITKNIYRDAFQHGYNKIQDGITYREMIHHLKSIGYNTINDRVFGAWFYNNFHSSMHYYKVNNTTQSFSDVSKLLITGSITDLTKIPDLINTRMFITGESVMRLLEFKELEESRKSSNKALVFAIIALFVSSTISILSQYLQYSYN